LRRLAVILLISWIWPVGAASKTRPSAPPPQGQENVFVYLAPFPGDAARLRFRVERLSAVKEDGTKIPLSHFITEIDGREVNRERRFASAPLPPDSYAGLEVEVAAAELEGAEGTAELLPPEGPVRIASPFRITKQQAVVLTLRFDYRKSIGEEYRFTPVFEAGVPARPAVGLLALVSSRGSDTVTLFDKVSGRVVGIVPTGRQPSGMALDEERRQAYVAISGEDTVIAIGLMEYTVLRESSLQGGDEPIELALTPDGNTLLSANPGSGMVSVIEVPQLVETDRIRVGDEPRSILVDNEGKRAYVFNTASSSITVINIRDREVVGAIGTDPAPFRGQFNRAGDVLYVIHRRSPFITLIDPSTLAVTNRVYVGPGATALKVNQQTDLIYLSRRGAGEIEIFDPLSLLPVDSILTEGEVSHLAIDEEQNNLYVVLPQSAQVHALEVVGKKPRAYTDVGDDPFWVALFGER
jgi:YVTN family beta-propeller protein